MPDLSGRCVLVVDDGIATGATTRAAVQAIRKAGAREIVVAVPTAPPSVYRAFGDDADEVIAVTTPGFFSAVGQSYRDFSQTTDEEVRTILERVWRSHAQKPDKSEGRE